MSFEHSDFVLEMGEKILATRDHEVRSGFVCPDERRNPGQLIALCHSELSECLEALRNGDPPDEHCPEFRSSMIELADAVIRIMGLAWELSGNDPAKLPQAIEAKMAFNRTRSPKHGKAF